MNALNEAVRMMQVELALCRKEYREQPNKELAEKITVLQRELDRKLKILINGW